MEEKDKEQNQSTESKAELEPGSPELEAGLEPEPEGSPELEASLSFLRQFDSFWKGYVDKIYQARMELTDPLLPRINHLRQSIRFYMIPALQKIGNLPARLQQNHVRHLPFLFSEDQIIRFFNHFYAVKKDEEKGWNLANRDPYRADELLLFDLYKVKRTMNGINGLLKELKTSRQVFPSAFKREQQTEILKGMNSALFMVFKMAVKPEYQVELFKNIQLNLLYEDQLVERRKKAIIYARGDKPDSNPYRRVFFHLLFRDTIKTKIKGKETVINYSLVNFEQLVEEYFNHFLDDSTNRVDIMSLYHSLHMQGNSFARNVLEEPDQETLLFEDIDEIKTII